jgi:hypothetical protein
LSLAALASLRAFAGRTGQLVVTKLSCRGFEPVDHILVTIVLAGETEPLDAVTTAALLEQHAVDIEWHAVGDDHDFPAIDVDVLEDAIDDAVLDVQLNISQLDEERFLKKLETLDRYLDDQVLVLRREQATLSRKLDDEKLKHQRATSPTAESKAKKAIDSLENKIQRLDERIEHLRQGKDSDYQQWRTRLFERRFSTPEIQRIAETTFEIRLVGDAAC